MNPWRVLALAAATAFSSASFAFTAIYSFGDSLSDDGNVYIATGGTQPASPPYYNGRYSNGLLWNENLAASQGLTMAPSLAGGTDYAFAGARSGSGYDGLIPNVDTQFGMFHAAVGTFQSTDLVTLWAGGNDFLDGVIDPTAPAQNMANSVANLYALGARNILVSNLPNLGGTPYARSQGAGVVAAATAWTNAFNASLAADLGVTSSGLSGLHLFDLDTNALYNQVISNPGAYGLSNVTDSYLDSGMVGDPNTYMFFDLLHPTAPVHELIGRAAAAAVPEPGSLVLLGLGLAGLALRRRGR